MVRRDGGERREREKEKKESIGNAVIRSAAAMAPKMQCGAPGTTVSASGVADN